MALVVILAALSLATYEGLLYRDLYPNRRLAVFSYVLPPLSLQQEAPPRRRPLTRPGPGTVGVGNGCVCGGTKVMPTMCV